MAKYLIDLYIKILIITLIILFSFSLTLLAASTISISNNVNFLIDNTVFEPGNLSNLTLTNNSTTLSYETSNEYSNWVIEVNVENTDFTTIPGAELLLNANQNSMSVGISQEQIILDPVNTPTTLISDIPAQTIDSSIELIYELKVNDVNSLKTGIYGGTVLFTIMEQ